MSRAREMRAARRAQQFSKFRLAELNLVPLVDTFVSIVFFALTAAAVGELAPVAPGVRLPDAGVGTTAYRQLTLGIGNDITLGGRRVMSAAEAAAARSDDARQPLRIPQLYVVLRQHADSIRRARGQTANDTVGTILAIQGDRSMRYDLLSRMMQTARSAGFRNLSLQVNRTAAPADPRRGTQAR